MLTNRRAVLHAEDDRLMTDLVGEHLRRAGFDYQAVHDPMKLIEELQRGRFRIVILDVHMPGKSGLQLLQEINRIDAGVQVLLLTALVNETTVMEASRLGADECLFKPMVEPERLVEAVENAYRRNSRWWATLRELTRRRREHEEAQAERQGVLTGTTATFE